LLTIFLFSGAALNLSWKKSDTQVLNHFSDIRTITQRIENGERLFIVVTADWCLTCKFNEQTVINTDWFKKLLEEKNMRLVMVDWTQQDSQIANFLKQYERVGIPFSAATETGHVHVLPELLTRSIVEDTLAKL
jgi:thiol:disulfide interchange protein DsbD